MSTGYFNVVGKLLILAGGMGEMEPPEGTVYIVPNLPTNDPNAIYYDLATDTVLEKQPFPITVKRNRIEDIPVGTTAYTSTGSEIVLDGEIEFDANTEHTEYVLLIHPHYINQEVAVEVGL